MISSRNSKYFLARFIYSGIGLKRQFIFERNEYFCLDSSPMQTENIQYESNGHKRSGVCTHYLCELVELHHPVVPIFIQPSHGFMLPKRSPCSFDDDWAWNRHCAFSSFFARTFLHHQSKGKHWLFFGEWNRDYDFFYEEDWLELSKKGHLHWI